MRNPKKSKKRKKCEINFCGSCYWFGKECFYLEGETKLKENKKSKCCKSYNFVYR